MKSVGVQQTRIFISYSHSDAKWLERLRIHLKPLERDYKIDVWDDTKIKPGEEWEKEISNALESSKVAVLLVSPEFLASDFITSNEVPKLLDSAKERGTLILTVFIRKSFLRNKDDILRYQAINDPSKPLNSLSGAEQDVILVKVAERINDALESKDVRPDIRTFPQNVIRNSIPSAMRDRRTMSMINETVVNISVCQMDILNSVISQEDYENIFERFLSIMNTMIKSNDGQFWARRGDSFISTFSQPESAVIACFAIMKELGTLNGEPALTQTPLFTRINLILNDQSSIQDIKENQRDSYLHPALEKTNELQIRCPIGTVAISLDIYERLGNFYQQFFRPTPDSPMLVLQSRQLSPQEEKLAYNLLPKQKAALPALCILNWDKLCPDIGLKDMRDLIKEDLVIVLGDTSSKPRGPLQSAATSDAVGLIEALAQLQNREIRVGIDTWQDTADLVASHNVLIVGSGASNMYALVLNDIIEPLHFLKVDGHVLDQIVTGPKGYEKPYSTHGSLAMNSGIIILSKSVFNPSKYIIWMAGITGMGTQAVAAFLKALIRGDAPIKDDTIGCIIGPYVQERMKFDVSDYFRKWRISDFQVLHQIDKQGNEL